MSYGLGEKLYGNGGVSKKSHTRAMKYWKRAKRRAERRRAKWNPECQASYGKYKGWES